MFVAKWLPTCVRVVLYSYVSFAIELYWFRIILYIISYALCSNKYVTKQSAKHTTSHFKILNILCRYICHILYGNDIVLG